MTNPPALPTFPFEAIRSGQMSLNDYLAQLEPFFETENERIQAFLPEEGRFARLRREAAALESRYPTPASITSPRYTSDAHPPATRPGRR